ncbi:MAG: caspase family protein [Thermoplasmatales archaeon]|nr:MAG: caspase family protein [Thermoplasmatales archaeon]
MKKILTIGITLLFIGMTISPVTGINLEKQSTMATLDGNTLHVGFDGNNESDHWALLIDSKGALFPTMENVLCLNGWQSDHIRTLEGEEATMDNLNNYFHWLDSMEDSEDTVLFYFHGHGGIGKFMLYNSMMSYGELGEKLDELESESIFVIIDSCYSGSAIDNLSQNSRVIITSAKANETSGSCRLTDPLFEGLEELADYLFEGNNDGFVSAEEAYWYAVNTEFWKYRPYSSSQSPQIDDKFDGELQITNISYRDDRLDQYQCLNSNLQGNKINDETWLAQSFKPGVKNITRLKLPLSRFGDPGDLIVSIRDSLNGSDLAVLTVPQDVIFGRSRLYDLDLEDISVTPWDTYYIVCRASNGDRNNGYKWLTCEETYSRGSSFITENGGESWESYQKQILGGKFYSDFCFFVFGKDKSQEKPPTPPSIIAGPKYGSIDHEYTYSANYIGEGPVYYKFSWGDGTYSSWLGPYNSGESCEAKHEYSNAGTYRIRATVKGAFEVESDWSTELNVCIMEPVWIIGTAHDLSEKQDYCYIKPETIVYFGSKSSIFGRFSIFSRLPDRFPILGIFFSISSRDIIVSKEYYGKLEPHFIFGRFNALILTDDEPID